VAVLLWIIYSLFLKDEPQPVRLSINIAGGVYVDKQSKASPVRHKDYSKPTDHAPSSSCSAMQFIVYSCGLKCDSVVEQEIGIVTAYLVAVLTNRTFVIARNSICNIGEFFQPNDYNWTECEDYVSNIPTNDSDIFSMSYTQTHRNRTKAQNDNLSNYFLSLLHKKVIILDINWNTFSIIKHSLVPGCTPKLRWIAFADGPDIFYHSYHAIFKPVPHLTDSLEYIFKNEIGKRHLICGLAERAYSYGRKHNKKERMAGLTAVSFIEYHYTNSSKYVTFVVSDVHGVGEQAVSKLPNHLDMFKALDNIRRFGQQNVPLTDSCKKLHTRILEQMILTRCELLAFRKSAGSQLVLALRDHPGGLFMFNDTEKRIMSVDKWNVADFVM